MRVLVTGAAGFIGQHLVRRLRRDGHAVRALVRTTVPPRDSIRGADNVIGDVCDAVAMKAAVDGCDRIFHLAGVAHAQDGQVDNTHHWAVTVEGTRNVLNGAVAAGVREVVYVSSVKAMGESTNGCLDESSPPDPQTAYGHARLAAERLVMEYGLTQGLHVTCLRLPLVYGCPVKGNLFRMIAAIDRGIFPPLPELGNRRSMVHVTDVVQAAVRAAEIPAAKGQCYIVTDGQTYSTRELYERICRSLGKEIPAWHVPVWTLKVLGGLGDAIGRVLGRRFMFDSDALDKLIGSAWYSSEKISRELGYRPVRCFEDALPEMIAWWRMARS